MKPACVILAAAVLAFSQTTDKKAPTPSAKPDTWQRSKECAEQAEKVMRDDRGTWENHYSPKYNKCFISVIDGGTGAFHGLARKRLLDAFERTTLATFVLGHAPADDPGWSCQIDFEFVKCAKAADFITEHMKN